jgi:hypothetical protein
VTSEPGSAIGIETGYRWTPEEAEFQSQMTAFFVVIAVKTSNLT